MEKEYLREQQVSEIYQISLGKLRNDRFLGIGLPYYKIGKSVRYSKQEVENYMQEHRVDPEAA